jgi:hypothetical protein
LLRPAALLALKSAPMRHDALVSAPDLTPLPAQVRAAARVLDNGEVMWPAVEAARAIKALASAQRVVLGLDVRDYQADGAFVEIPWSSFEPDGEDDVDRGCRTALDALRSAPLPGEWVLVTWR